MVHPRLQVSHRSRLRAMRIKHRELGLNAPRLPSGVCLYVSAPLIALDTKGRWCPAQIAALKEEQTMMKVHFVGWKKSHDFWCAFGDARVRPGRADDLVRETTGSQAIAPKGSRVTPRTHYVKTLEGTVMMLKRTDHRE